MAVPEAESHAEQVPERRGQYYHSYNCLVQIPTLAVFALDNLHDVFPVFGPHVQVRMKTTSVCQTFHYLMGHTYSVVKMQVFT